MDYSSETATHIVIRDTPYYNNPAQAEPPNGTLKAKTRVRVIQPSGSYTKVQTEDESIAGYVATSDIEPI